jgi:hypothetical protein
MEISFLFDQGLLTEGFFWIPSLAGPTTIAARQSGSGVSWLFPFVVRHFCIVIKLFKGNALMIFMIILS